MLKRMVCSLAVLVLVMLMAPGSVPANAQDATELKYGGEASGKLAADGSVAYTFKGDKGDIVVVQVVPAADGGLLGSEVKIADDKGNKLADSSALIIFGRTGTIVGAELSKAATYTITVFSTSKSNEGGFTISLVQAEAMEKGKPVEGTAESTPDGERSRYKTIYAIRPDQDAQLTYSKTEGEYTPAVVVYAAASGNNLFPAMYMGGSNLTNAALTITNQDGLYFVAVGDLGFASFGSGDKGTKTATFKLGLDAPESGKSSN